MTLNRWVRLLAMILLIGLALSLVVAPLFALLLAIAIALLIEQRQTNNPGAYYALSVVAVTGTLKDAGAGR